MSAKPQELGPPNVGAPPASTIPLGLRVLGMALRALFIGALVVVTVRVSSPQSETFASVCETPGDLIGLEGEFRDDQKNPAATKARIAAIIATETADTWRSRFAGKDCCCSIVANLGDAFTDPHYMARGVFDHVLTNPEGAAMPALPVPLDAAFRAVPATAIASPALGADNKTYLA